MEIEQIRKEKKLCEDTISKLVNTVIDRFEEETGETPHSIYLKMIEINEFGKATKHIVSDVEFEIKI